MAGITKYCDPYNGENWKLSARYLSNKRESVFFGRQKLIEVNKGLRARLS